MASEAKEVIVSHGKVLEPTGEKRMPLNGEFYREHDGVRQAGHDFSNNTWPIYREIKINEMANRLSAAEQRAEEAELERDIARTEMRKVTTAIETEAAKYGIEWHGSAETMIQAVLEAPRRQHANMAAEFELIAAGKHPDYVMRWDFEGKKNA